MVWTTENGQIMPVCKECYQKKAQRPVESGEELKDDSASGGVMSN